MDKANIVLFLILISFGDTSLEIESLNKLKNYAKDFLVDYDYTKEKIKIFKNILPYLPEDYIYTGGRSIIATEKILNVLETIEYIQIESQVPIDTLDLEPMNRAYKIVNILQGEIDNANINKLGTVLDVLVNRDQYLSMVNIALEFLNNKDSLKNPNNIAKLIKPLIGEIELESSTLGKMIDILDKLEQPSQST